MGLRQASDAPTTKTWAAVIAGAITTVLVWAIREVVKIDIPAEIAMAFQTIVSFAASYLTPPGQKDVVREVVTTPVQPPPDGELTGTLTLTKTGEKNE